MPSPATVLKGAFGGRLVDRRSSAYEREARTESGALPGVPVGDPHVQHG